MADYPAMARAAAARKGLPPDRFDRQMSLESMSYDERVITCRMDSPAGARGIAQLMPVHWSMVDPCDPDAATEYAAGLMRGHLDYWLSLGKDAETAYGLALASYNAGRQATIDGLAGRKAWWPFRETVTYLSDIMEITEDRARAIMTGGSLAVVTYNKQEPNRLQEHSFDCSQESLEWALWALGRKPTDGWMEATMIQEGVMSAEQGLLNASGEGLAAFVGRHWGEFGYYANHEPAVSFEMVAAEGTGTGVNGHAYPLLIGGRNWGGPGLGHWAAVRDYDAARGVLLLANPAGSGPQFGGQEMTQGQFQARGPFSMVRVLHPDLLKVFEAPPPPEPPPFDRDAVVAALRSHLALIETHYAQERASLERLIEMAGAA